MTEAEEALLFAMQAGDSAALTPSAKLRANLRGEDKASSEFYEATEDVDLHVAFERGGAAASFTASAAMNPISFMRRARRRRNCAA